MEGLTGSEIAGFVVGALLLGATVAAPRVDGFIASSQRRSLSLSCAPVALSSILHRKTFLLWSRLEVGLQVICGDN
jgi:hypothetical protein